MKWIFLVGLVGLLLSGCVKNTPPMGFDCYEESAVLNSQYIDKTDSTHGGDCSQGCLFMNVTAEHISFLPCGHIDKIESKEMIYFFTNEDNLRNDLKSGDNIKVTWCYNLVIKDRRIRNIQPIQ